MPLFTQPPPETTSSELRQLAFDYNWDDGFAFPQAIADHPSCDLAVALDLFWLADAISVYLGEAHEHAYNIKWREFCNLLTQRLLEEHYKQGSTAFEVPLTRTEIYKYRQRGVPELLLTNVNAVRA